MANWQVLSEHRRTLKGMLQTAWPLLMFAIASLGFAAMFFSIWIGRKAQTDMLIASGVMQVIAIGLLGATAWKALLSASPVQIFEEGLQWQQDGRERQRGWDEVREVWRKELYRLINGARPSEWNRHSDLRVVFTDGEQVRFNHSLSNYNVMADFVQRATSERLLPAARRELSGPGVRFGSLQLSHEGLTLGNERLPWSVITNIRAGRGFLCVVDMRGKQHDIALQDVPNYPVLLKLLEEVRQPASIS
jgi:hypothetical protein